VMLSTAEILRLASQLEKYQYVESYGRRVPSRSSVPCSFSALGAGSFEFCSSVPGHFGGLLLSSVGVPTMTTLELTFHDSIHHTVVDE
jgi:hypothetical protein